MGNASQIVFVTTLASSFLFACGSDPKASTTSSVATASSAASPGSSTAEACADDLLAAIDERSGEALAAVAHPIKGIRFTPFSFVSTRSDVVLDASALRVAFTDGKVRDWGILGESDEHIVATPAAYFTQYVHDPAARAWDTTPGSTTSREAVMVETKSLHADLSAAYPDGRVVKLSKPPSHPEDAAHDWVVLRIVCEPYRGGFYAVGVVRSVWTP